MNTECPPGFAEPVSTSAGRRVPPRVLTGLRRIAALTVTSNGSAHSRLEAIREIAEGLLGEKDG